MIVIIIIIVINKNKTYVSDDNNHRTESLQTRPRAGMKKSESKSSPPSQMQMLEIMRHHAIVEREPVHLLSCKGVPV